MTWYQYTLLSLSVVLYALSQLHTFGKLKWQEYKNRNSFFGVDSWIRKYKDGNPSKGRDYFGSTTFLVWTTDFYHLAQFIMKISLSIGIFNFTLQAIWFWLGWTVIQWLTFKICSKY